MAQKPCNPAVLDKKYAALASDFGLEWATKLFGAEAIASLPKFVRGKDAGKPKGYVIWQKATKGGWCRDVQGVVAHGALVDAWIAVSPFMFRHEALTGHWLGRVQSLGGVAHYMFEEGRARVAAEQAKEAERRFIENCHLDGDWLAKRATPEQRAEYAASYPERVEIVRSYLAEYHAGSGVTI